MTKYNLTEKKHKTPFYCTSLNPQMIERLYEKVMSLFVIDKKYRDPDYSAQKMAKELNTNTRYLSAVINLRSQNNYSQLVNEFRVKEAMYMLKDPVYSKYTMEEVAKQVGFSTRQSFYSAFYRRTGVTPKEFRKINAANLYMDSSLKSVDKQGEDPSQ